MQQLARFTLGKISEAGSCAVEDGKAGKLRSDRGNEHFRYSRKWANINPQSSPFDTAGSQKMDNLPTELIRYINEWLSPVEWIRFIQSSAKLYHPLRQSRYYSLKEEFSKKYYYNQNGFRDQFLERTRINPKSQLSLHFSDDFLKSSEIDGNIARNLHSLSILNAYSLQSVDTLSELTKLSLHGSYQVQSYSILKNVQYLILSGVYLSSCDGLGDIFHLNLSGCGFTDITALGNHHYLNLSESNSVIEVNHLHNVRHTLILSGCEKVTNVSQLGNIPHLFLRKCKGLVTLPSHCYNLELDISYCDQITNASMLGTVKQSLKLGECLGLTSVAGLGRVPRLSLFKCQNILTIDSLTYVMELDLSFCRQIFDLSGILHVKRLNLSYCESAQDISNLTHLEKLTLRGWKKNTLIKQLPLYCPKLKFLDLIGASKGLPDEIRCDVSNITYWKKIRIMIGLKQPLFIQ